MSVRSRLSPLIAVLALTLTLAACGGEVEPTAKSGDLVKEYFRSGDVEGDFVTGSGEDRMAHLASRATPDQFLGSLFSAHSCEQSISVVTFTTECRVPDAARAQDGKLFQRFALVKHEDGSLELLRLTLVRAKGGSSVLYDTQGGRYPDGLQDFQENNGLLDHADQMLVPKPLTATDGQFRLAVVAGQTGVYVPTWAWWLLGGLVAVVVLGVPTLLLQRARRTGPTSST